MRSGLDARATGMMFPGAGDRAGGRCCAVERDLRPARRCPGKAFGHLFGDEGAVGEDRDDQPHPRERLVDPEEVGPQKDLPAGEEQKGHAGIRRLAGDPDPVGGRKLPDGPRTETRSRTGVTEPTGQVAPVGQLEGTAGRLAVPGGPPEQLPHERSVRGGVRRHGSRSPIRPRSSKNGRTSASALSRSIPNRAASMAAVPGGPVLGEQVPDIPHGRVQHDDRVRLHDHRTDRDQKVLAPNRADDEVRAPPHRPPGRYAREGLCAALRPRHGVRSTAIVIRTVTWGALRARHPARPDPPSLTR